MPLGAFRLNSIAKVFTPAAPSGLSFTFFRDAQLQNTEQASGGTSLWLEGGDSAGGLGDYIKFSDTTDIANFGTGDFTVELWIYAQHANGENIYFYDSRASGGTGTWAFYRPGSTNKLGWFTGSATLQSTTSFATYNEWVHVAYTRTGSTGEFFVNGDSYGTVTDSNNYTVNNTEHTIGQHWSGFSTTETIGYIDEVRISDSQRYTGTFSPSQRFNFDGNTKLLLHFDGTSGATDTVEEDAAEQATYASDSNSSSLELLVPFDRVNGTNDDAVSVNTSLSGAKTKAGPGQRAFHQGQTYYFTDYLTAYEGSQTGNTVGGVHCLTYDLSSQGGTGFGNAASATYTLEMWVKATDGTTNNNWCLSSGDSGGRWLFGINTSGSITFGNENNIGLGDSNWHHIAIVNDAGTHRFYLDAIYKGAWYSVNTGFNTLHVGEFTATGGANFRGQIQDLRVYQGSANYSGTNSGSANFTLPSSAISSFS